MSLFSRIAEWFKKLWRGIDRRFIIPVYQWIIRFFSGRLGKRIEGGDGLPDWKQDAIRDFRLWLEDLPEPVPTEEGRIPEGCDLFTLMAEFISLRKEIQMQNREQWKSLQNLDAIIDAYHDAADLFKERTRDIGQLEERVRRASEKRAVMPFLEIRDALSRGLSAAREVAASKSILRSSPKGIDGVVEGYEMALRRFDRALSLVGVTPVETVGRTFDARTMKAVDKRSETGQDKGVVIQEQLSGFVRDDEVVRYAEVVVNE